MNHNPSNKSIAFCSINSCDDAANQDGGHAYSRDGSFGCNIVRSMRVNSRDATLAYVWQALNALLIEVSQGCKFGDAFVS